MAITPIMGFVRIMYGPLVRSGGLIGFHDIVEAERDAPLLKTRSIVRPHKSSFGGIGMIFV